jgi:hypothetical protein
MGWEPTLSEYCRFLSEKHTEAIENPSRPDYMNNTSVLRSSSLQTTKPRRNPAKGDEEAHEAVQSRPRGWDLQSQQIQDQKSVPGSQE